MCSLPCKIYSRGRGYYRPCMVYSCSCLHIASAAGRELLRMSFGMNFPHEIPHGLPQLVIRMNGVIPLRGITFGTLVAVSCAPVVSNTYINFF